VIPSGVRTVAIIAGLAAIVAFVPHGSSSAGLVGQLIIIALSVMFALFGARLYQMFRTDIYGLGDGHRAILYGSLGLFVLAMAGRPKLAATGIGTLVLVVMFGAALGGAFACFMRWRAYRV
jgi:hypothetical protein